jgi:hypothetical protein
MPEDRMPEAEVSLRLAIFLITNNHALSDVKVAIDGAQVQVGDRVIFPLIDFLKANGWYKKELGPRWQGNYYHDKQIPSIVVHSYSGEGDVVTKLNSGLTLRAESKKGPTRRSKSSAEYPLMWEALGQLLTVEHVGDNDLLAIAVPSSDKFNELAIRWREAPLIKRFGIRILTVDRNSQVTGFSNLDLQ